MNDSANFDYPAEYLALKAANDRLRELGRERLSNLINKACAETDAVLASRGVQNGLQTGRQSWEFKVDNSVMVGERIGLRYQTRTLTVEIGWPRLPEHGFVPDGGLARGRISISQNVMIDAQPLAELILKRQERGEPAWHLLSNNKIGEAVTEYTLRRFIDLILQS